MTATQYAPLFRIECLHGYSGGLCPDITVSPTAGCRALLDRYRMLFRGSGASGTVYAPVQAQSNLLQGFDESCPFTFTLTSSGALDSYTDFTSGRNAAPVKDLFYFDNTASHQTEVMGAQRQLLHTPDGAFTDAPVPVRPRIFNYVPESLSSQGELQVIEPLTREALWQSPGGSAVDLRRLPEGRYQLVLDGKDLDRFFLSDRPAAQQWGAISIYAGGSRQAPKLPAACRTIDSDGAITFRTFTLSLEARKTIWRYYVIDPAGKQDFSGYELTGTVRKPQPGAASEIIFARSPETKLIDGRKAWVFESQLELPLLQAPANELSLTLRPAGNGTRGERNIRLPYARPESLALKNGTGPGSSCSEIFVYV